MYNWSVDTTSLKKNPEAYEKFVLEQQINFGLNGKRLSVRALKKHWSDLDLNPAKKNFLKKLLWPQS